MRKIDCDVPVKVYGAEFDDIYEVVRCACRHEPKDGVYVGEDSQLYPCFDYEDFASETRYYWNFVFATSESEMQEKLAKLKEMDTLDSDYYKLTEDLAPMAYWGGDTNRQVFLTDNQACTGMNTNVCTTQENAMPKTDAACSEPQTLDIRSNEPYPSGVLSNLCSNGFRLDGMVCGSMEGFLQSLKRQDMDKQRQICSMKGGNARKMSVTSWQTDQIVWWKGKAIDRQGAEYQELLRRAYRAMFEQSERFRTALMQTRGMTLTHSSGENNPYKTILTPAEFCGILAEMRDGYDRRDKTQELIDKSVCRKRLLYLYENGNAATNAAEQVLKEQLADIEVIGFDMKGSSEMCLEHLRNLCKDRVPDVVIGNGLDEERLRELLVPLLQCTM